MRAHRLVPLVLLTLFGVLAPAPAQAETWTRVGTGTTGGVSGLAPRAAGGWVVVHDSKNAGKPRLGILDAAHHLTDVAWPGTAPVDLEAVAAVPGTTTRFAVLTSSGAGTVVSLTGTTLSVVRGFTVPTGRTESEAFALASVGGRTVAVWGTRGSPTAAGRLYAATFDVAGGTFGAVSSASVRVPYPTGNVRHVSDATVVGGRVRVSSASDGGDDGPFTSAVYDVGTVTLSSGQARLTPGALRSLGRFTGHKVEGLACRGTSGLLGTDDENLGGFTTPLSFCG